MLTIEPNSAHAKTVRPSHVAHKIVAYMHLPVCAHTYTYANPYI